MQLPQRYKYHYCQQFHQQQTINYYLCHRPQEHRVHKQERHEKKTQTSVYGSRIDLLVQNNKYNLKC